MSHHSGSKKSVSAEVIALRKQVADLKESAVERRRVEDALRESENLHRLTLEEAPVGILRVSPLGHVLYTNTGFIHLLGYESRQEFKTIGELRGVFLDREAAIEMLVSSRSAAREVMLECVRRDGTSVALRLRLGSSGESGFTLVHSD